MTLDEFLLENSSLRNDEPHLIKHERKLALEALQKRRLTSEEEKLFACRFHPPQKKSDPSYEKYVLPECSKNYILFVDGFLRLDLSSYSEKLIVYPLSQAIKSYSTTLQASFHDQHLEKELFSLIHRACFQEGVFIYLPKEVALTQPLQILFLSSSYTKPSFAFPKVHLSLGSFSSMTCFETHVSEGESPLLENSMITCDMSDFSSLKHRLHEPLRGHVQPSFCFSTFAASLRKEATLSSIITLKGPFHTHFCPVRLKDESATCTLKGIWQGKEQDRLRLRTHVHHQASHTRSHQLFKGIVQDSSHSLFEGHVHISEEAHKAEASQYTHNMVLHPTAEAIFKPYLDIYASDVKASHGATAGKIDEAALFYLRSRGLDKKDAQETLLKGFLTEVFHDESIYSTK